MLGRKQVVGPFMFPAVECLFDVIGCAEWRLPPDKLAAYLSRLSDPKKHEDALVEFAPILRLDDSVGVQHEVKAASKRETTVDWIIEAPNYPTLMLEVKNRLGDLIESFNSMNGPGWENEIPPPGHDHALLFRNVERKFEPRPPERAIHAVWIRSQLLQEESEFQVAFEALPFEHVHAAILGDWGEDAYVVASDSLTKKSVLKILRLNQSKSRVFRRPSPLCS